MLRKHILQKNIKTHPQKCGNTNVFEDSVFLKMSLKNKTSQKTLWYRIETICSTLPFPLIIHLQSESEQRIPKNLLAEIFLYKYIRLLIGDFLYEPTTPFSKINNSFLKSSTFLCRVFI